MGWVEGEPEEAQVGDTEKVSDRERDLDEIGDEALYPYGPAPQLIREVNASGVEVIRSSRGPADEEARQSVERKLKAAFAKEHAGDATGRHESDPEGSAALLPDAAPGSKEANILQPDGVPPPLQDRPPRGPERVPLRGELFQPDAPGLYPFSRPTSELKLSREDVLPRDGETHLLLNAIIGECHFLMREVTFRSLCRATELEDRMTWLTASMKLAETGARVGDSVARLLNGPEIRHTQHTQMIQHGQVAAVANAASGKPSGRKAGKKKGGGRGSASP
ncbi:MAG TPA: hypothetical protein VIM02_04985 [Rhizomicrobium sp.]|jgi:hypothetical protein